MLFNSVTIFKKVTEMKYISQFTKKVISRIMFMIESCIVAISEDMQLLAFMIITIIPDICIKVRAEMPIFNIKSLLFNFSWFCLIVAFSYTKKTKKSRTIYFVTMTGINFLLTYGNILYYQFYYDFLSLSYIKQLGLFFDVADATAVKISLFDYLYWIIFVIAISILILLGKHQDANFQFSEKGVFNRVNFLRLSIVVFILGIFMLAPANFSQAQKFWNRPIVVQDFGLYNYHVLDIYQSMGVFIKHTPSENEYLQFVKYFEKRNKTPHPINQYTGILEGKNIIVIHAESIENFVINLEMYDLEGNLVEVTPNLNKLAKEGLYFSNFYSQHSIGTSADSEFVFNTSLLPMNNGAVYMTNFDHKYVTTQSLLKDIGYTTLYMHGNNGSFWNRDDMYKVMGYDTFYERRSYEYDEEQTIGLGINDYTFFQQSIEFIAQAQSPYWATLITLTNHTPWDDMEKYIVKDELGTELPQLNCEINGIDNTTMCRYLNSTRYSDWALGEFLKGLENRNLLENSVIVLYGDHPAKLPIEDLEKFFDKEISSFELNIIEHVPFIIWSKENLFEPQEITKVMGEFDVGPTLQNMLGIKNEFALGNDIFSIENNVVPFLNGDWVDDIVYYSYRDNEYIIVNDEYTEEMIMEMIKNDDYINVQRKKVEEIILISNMVNKYDLIAYHEKKVGDKS